MDLKPLLSVSFSYNWLKLHFSLISISMDSSVSEQLIGQCLQFLQDLILPLNLTCYRVG